MVAIDPIADIGRVLTGLVFESASEFRLGSHTFHATESEIVTKLQHAFYQHCFCVPFGETSPPDGAGDHVAELSAANSGRDSLEPGWRLDRPMSWGQYPARKGDRERLLWPGEFVSAAGPGVPPQPGMMVSVFFPRESRIMQLGFYFAFGNTGEEEFDDFAVVRFYWAVSATAAPLLVSRVTTTLNRFQVPFRMKLPSDRSSYGRLDAAVLYVHKRWFQICAICLEPIYRELANRLMPGTPLFAKPLAPGLGLAEDPGSGESFGMHRCRLLAEGVLRAQQNAGPPLEEVRRRFAADGISLERPWLNAGSVDQYNFPADGEPIL